jgi:hypothetical protein
MRRSPIDPEDEGQLMGFLSDTSYDALVGSAVEAAMALDGAGMPDEPHDFANYNLHSTMHLAGSGVFDPNGGDFDGDGASDLLAPSLRVGNVPPAASVEVLQEYFSQFGCVAELRIDEDASDSYIVRFDSFDSTDLFLRSDLEFQSAELDVDVVEDDVDGFDDGDTFGFGDDTDDDNHDAEVLFLRQGMQDDGFASSDEPMKHILHPNHDAEERNEEDGGSNVNFHNQFQQQMGGESGHHHHGAPPSIPYSPPVPLALDDGQEEEMDDDKSDNDAWYEEGTHDKEYDELRADIRASEANGGAGAETGGGGGGVDIYADGLPEVLRPPITSSSEEEEEEEEEKDDDDTDIELVLKALSVREIKRQLDALGAVYSDCIEKSELVTRLKDSIVNPPGEEDGDWAEKDEDEVDEDRDEEGGDESGVEQCVHAMQEQRGAKAATAATAATGGMQGGVQGGVLSLLFVGEEVEARHGGGGRWYTGTVSSTAVLNFTTAAAMMLASPCSPHPTQPHRIHPTHHSLETTP